MSEELEITLLDRTLTIACPAGEEEALLESAEMLNQQMLKVRAQKPSLSLLNIALLSALNLSHQVLTQSALISTSDEAIERLCLSVSQALEN